MKINFTIIFLFITTSIIGQDTHPNVSPHSSGTILGIDSNLFFAILFGIIGLIGTVYTIISFLYNKKEKRTYKYLFDIADKNIDKNVTEEELKQKKEKVQAYSEKIIELQNKIENEIPKQARIAVLRDKFFTLSESLTETFSSLKKTEKELKLKEVTLDATIPSEILKEIENEIAPTYLLKERRSRIKNYITIFTSAAAIISALLPYPFDDWFAFPLLIIAVPFVYQLLKSYLPAEKEMKKLAYTKFYRITFFVIGATGLSFSLFLFIIWLFEPDNIDLLFIQIISGISFFLTGVGIIYHLNYKRLKKSFKHN